MITQWFNNRKVTMGCRQYADLLNEYVDGRLGSDLMWKTKNHLSVCTTCRETVEALVSVSQMLGSVTRREVSQGFNAALEARIAATPRKVSRTPWLGVDFSSLLISQGSRQQLRLVAPGIALACCLLLAIFVSRSPNALTPNPPANATVTHSDQQQTSEQTVIQACLNQHRAQATSDPLSDTSAQLLTASVDTIPANPSQNQHLTDADASVLLDEEM